MNAPTAVEPRVDDDRVLVDIEPQGLIDDYPHAGVVHRTHVNVTYLAAREPVDLGTTLTHPSFVTELAVVAAVYGFNRFFPTLIRRRIKDGEQGILARLPVKQFVKIHRGVNRISVDLLDNMPGLYRGRGEIDWPALNHLGDLYTVAGIRIIVK